MQAPTVYASFDIYFFFSRSADCVLPHGDMQSHVAIATYQLLIYSTYITF